MMNVRHIRVSKAHSFLTITVLAMALGLAFALSMISQKLERHQNQRVWAQKADMFLTQDLTSNLPILEPVALTQLGPDYINWAAEALKAYHCLSEAVYYEARSETLSGQMAVADVVKNRVASKHYPNNICDVVYEGAALGRGCQFSFVCDGSMTQKPKGQAWERAQAIAKLSLSGQMPDMTQNSTHYHTVQVEPDWAGTLAFKRQIGSHKFYRPSWRERNIAQVSTTLASPG